MPPVLSEGGRWSRERGELAKHKPGDQGRPGTACGGHVPRGEGAQSRATWHFQDKRESRGSG